ncbi:2,3-bisphosphoglycerate-independent phosphoglycerate mutase [Candidatus Dependentiae bacterium]|nr:2,3-bisphosphoglycerate-independent phosphoglycerate mutase [Candidatus Dependentiae bacterium]
MSNKKPVLLVILDGFGYSSEKKYNAIAQAHTPHLNSWFSTYPHTVLDSSGKAVGLLGGYIGNSEVGHLTIGAGAVVPQAVAVIHSAIDTGSFFKNKKLTEALTKLTHSKKILHIFGLLSDAGVHSHIKHLFAYIKAAREHKIQKIVIHPFLDGRDTPPKSGKYYLEQLSEYIKSMSNVIIGSLHGRFYAMDRDNNWKRTQKSYRVLTEQIEPTFVHWSEVLEYYYTKNITDEFIPPTLLSSDAIIQNGDGILFFNFRPDRARQLTKAFIDKHFSHFSTKKINLTFFITPVAYNKNINTTVLFARQPLKNTLKHILSKSGKTIFTIAETEKYAHVTYFFSGGQEQALPGETQVLIPSLPKKNYVDHPQMSAEKITEAIVHSLKNAPTNFYLINYANADMVAHSGNLPATIKAIEYLDTQLAHLYKTAIEKMNGIMIITSDHGNAEVMFDKKTQQPRTAHTTNPVPFLYIGHDYKNIDLSNLRKLSDIKNFVLKIMESPN